ncbi:MAG: arylsulfatase [Bacteriovoracaceae bacterium]|nr:arylsulfatase [Bacteriovoracaceae bacterium]
MRSCIFISTLFCSHIALAQSSLPLPDAKNASIAKKTIQASKHRPLVPVKKLENDVPNIVIMMLDDSAPALPDTFGGPVHTPTLSRVAKDGITYNRFHNTAMCSPTRAALLTGRNHHRVSSGIVMDFANGWDGYTGMWPRSTSSIARVLGEYGYATGAFGKWHNTPLTETTQVGPFDRWPTGKHVGFDYFYGFLAGATSQFNPSLVENTSFKDKPQKKDYHLTEDITNRAISWIRNSHAQKKPFLVYWVPGAPHSPHHIFKNWADKYKGKFDGGWDKMRETIYAKQKELGWIPSEAKLTSRPEGLVGWDEIPENQKPFQTRLMEVYAGMTEHTDNQGGRILDELERLGIRDNTLIIYIWGDNGGSAEGQSGTITDYASHVGAKMTAEQQMKYLEKLGGLDAIGTEKIDSAYHYGWAWAGSTPYKGAKGNVAHFGGTRTPLAISWPKGIKPDKTPRTQFHHVNDIAPTIYDLLKIKAPATVDGVKQAPMDGISMRYTFASAKEPEKKKQQYFEMVGSQAYYQNGWMASTVGLKDIWKGMLADPFKWNPENDTWEIYDLRNDFTQSDDLAASQSKRVGQMKKDFYKVAEQNKVFPVGGAIWNYLLHPEERPHNPAKIYEYNQGVQRLAEIAGPWIGSRSNVIDIDLEVGKDASGVIYATGGYSGGIALWMDKGILFYEYNFFRDRSRLKVGKLSEGKVRLQVSSKLQGGTGSSMLVTVKINDKETGKIGVPQTGSSVFTYSDSFDVGRDSYSPVIEDYYARAPFEYNNVINSFVVKYVEE